MGITNSAVEDHINALFGNERAAGLREEIKGKKSWEREALVLENLAQALKEMGGKFVLPFRFRNSSGARMSHSLIFVTKHFKGYEIMKEIMAKESTNTEQGVPSFEYSLADTTMPLLFSLSNPLDDLERNILDEFAGRSLSMYDIYYNHSVDRPYIKRNYKDALLKLEKAGKISCSPAKRRKDTFGDDVIATFPNEET